MGCGARREFTANCSNSDSSSQSAPCRVTWENGRADRHRPGAHSHTSRSEVPRGRLRASRGRNLRHQMKENDKGNLAEACPRICSTRRTSDDRRRGSALPAADAIDPVHDDHTGPCSIAEENQLLYVCSMYPRSCNRNVDQVSGMRRLTTSAAPTDSAQTTSTARSTAGSCFPTDSPRDFRDCPRAC
jgi:hypothetical protein